MSTDSVTSASDNSSEALSFEERIKIRKSHSRTITLSRRSSRSSDACLREIRATESNLLEIQIEESKEYEYFSSLWKDCEWLEEIFRHIIQYVDCVKLQTKATNRLSIAFNNLILRENCLTEKMSGALRDLCCDPVIDPWNNIKTNIYDFMKTFEQIKDHRSKFDEDKNNYEIAMKNFKTVLEVMNISMKELDKLMNQFEQVLWQYQHSRCLLIRNMQETKEIGLRFLGNVCGLMNRENKATEVRGVKFNDLLENLEKIFDIGKQSTMQVSRTLCSQ
ncbi:hypothetical protein WA026_018345 [Henosepilachna vigintioctopunctata]|uniref:Uncharacterized protein n=1 Tax=Henosepilachna vigintioctopunctata TaxID=420089 RepID=A0AAW1VFR6_9CUCU